MRHRLLPAILTAAVMLAAATPARAADPPSAAPASPAASPAASPSPAASSRLQFTTLLTPQNAIGAFSGTMTLTIAADGTIKGSYTPESGGPRSVSGTLKGKDIDLSFGASVYMEVTGTYAGGIIDGQTILKSRPFRFKAIPKT